MIAATPEPPYDAVIFTSQRWYGTFALRVCHLERASAQESRG